MRLHVSSRRFELGARPPSSAAPPGYNQGYADQLLKLERDRYTQLQLVEPGCGGESTGSMLDGSQDRGVAASCGPPSFYAARYPDSATRLAEAVAFLREHRGSVAFVTIDIGANDLLGPGGLGPALTNLPLILAALRTAAGDGVPIIGMNYYDPFAPQAWSQGGLPALEAQVAGVVAFNDVLASVGESLRGRTHARYLLCHRCEWQREQRRVHCHGEAHPLEDAPAPISSPEARPLRLALRAALPDRPFSNWRLDSERMADEAEIAEHYSALYGQFAADVHASVRGAAFGQDIGQNSWLTVDELEQFSSWLELRESSRLLDVACGSGGPALHLARVTGCSVTGVELYEQAVSTADTAAREAGLEERARFLEADARRELPLDDATFDAILCVDAINHFPDRRAVFADWRRLLRPEGRLVFTDPLVVTGPLGSDEIAVRTSIGYGLFVPLGGNERLLRDIGLGVLRVHDTTESTAQIAYRRYEARAQHSERLRQVEGETTFEGRQRFFQMAATLAREHRLSRLAFIVAKAT